MPSLWIRAVDHLPDRGERFEAGLATLGGFCRVREPRLERLGYNGSMFHDAEPTDCVALNTLLAVAPQDVELDHLSPAG